MDIMEKRRMIIDWGRLSATALQMGTIIGVGMLIVNRNPTYLRAFVVGTVAATAIVTIQDPFEDLAEKYVFGPIADRIALRDFTKLGQKTEKEKN